MLRTPLLLLALIAPSFSIACAFSGAEVIKANSTLVGRLDLKTPMFEDVLWFIRHGSLFRCRGAETPTCTRLMAVPDGDRWTTGFDAFWKEGKAHLVAAKYTDVLWLGVGKGQVHRCASTPDGTAKCSLVYETGVSSSLLANFESVSAQIPGAEAIWLMTEDQRVYRCSMDSNEPKCELVPGS